MFSFLLNPEVWLFVGVAVFGYSTGWLTGHARGFVQGVHEMLRARQPAAVDGDNVISFERCLRLMRRGRT